MAPKLPTKTPAKVLSVSTSKLIGCTRRRFCIGLKTALDETTELSPKNRKTAGLTLAIQLRLGVGTAASVDRVFYRTGARGRLFLFSYCPFCGNSLQKEPT